MKKNAARFLPLAILPAILPATLLPIMATRHVSDGLIGGTMGFFIGLSIVGLVVMVKQKRHSA